MTKKIWSLLLACLLLTACDEGKIYPEQPAEHDVYVAMNTAFKGLNAWPRNYLIVLASFGDNDREPLSTAVIPEPTTTDGKASVRLGLSGQEKKIAISLVTKGTPREVIYNFYTYTIDNTSAAEINLPIEEIDIAFFGRIQSQIFNDNCIACHGGSTHAAARLYLTEGKSHPSLVNVQADLSHDGQLFVMPGKASQSFLMDILQSDIVKYNHSDILASNPELITLVKTWIEEDAKE